jgi:hypothetical protein
VMSALRACFDDSASLDSVTPSSPSFVLNSLSYFFALWPVIII